MQFFINQVFENIYPPEAAVWCNKNNAYIERVNGKFTILAVPEPSLEELKALKLTELSQAHLKAEEDAHILSSLGFTVNANSRALRDIEGLLLTTLDGATVKFRAYDNSTHDIAKVDLQVLQKEVIKNSQYLYAQKWKAREMILSAKTTEELEGAVPVFEMLNILVDINQ